MKNISIKETKNKDKAIFLNKKIDTMLSMKKSITLKLEQYKNELDKIVISSKKNFRKYKKNVLKIINFENKLLLIESKKNSFVYKKYFLDLHEKTNDNKIGSVKILSFLNFLENINAQKDENIPYNFFVIQKLRHTAKKYKFLLTKLKYLEDIKLRIYNSKNKSTFFLIKQCKNLEKRIKSLQIEYKNTVDSYFSRYHSKWVTRLEKSKKMNYYKDQSADNKFKNEIRNKSISEIKEVDKKIKELKIKISNLPKAESKLKDEYLNEIEKLISEKKKIQNYYSNYLDFDSQENAVILKNVVKYYNNKIISNRILNNVNLTIKKGEFVVILGPSGSGKTTLLNIISGMDNASSGTVIIFGKDITNYNQNQLTKFRRQNVGYVFQHYGLLPNLTVKENIQIGQRLQSNKNKIIPLNEILTSIDMSSQINKYPSELSGGQQQRVSIARSIAKNPNILFGDEPTGAIDTEMSKQVMKLFIEINKKYRSTVIIVTHNPLLAELATMVIYVNNGNISNIKYNNHPKSVDDLNWNYNSKT